MDNETPRGRVVIAGGSGFIGSSLTRHLSAIGYEVVVLSRRAGSGNSGARVVLWDGRTVGAWAAELDGTDAVINLAGRSVDCIKTPDHCDEILRSRVDATAVLGAAMRSVKQPPRVWVQMSTAHIYGDPPECVCDEDSALGYGLAPEVGRAWEKAFAAAIPEDVRGVVLRTSFVLGRDGGPLARLARLARLGLGGTIGHGQQGISWIHEIDMNRLFERALTDSTMRGVYIATAPEPVSNRAFMQSLRRAVRMPIGLPTAAWMVRVAAPLVLRTDPELALYGRYCVSRRLADEGFEFEFADADSALSDLLTR